MRDKTYFLTFSRPKKGLGICEHIFILAAGLKKRKHPRPLQRGDRIGVMVKRAEKQLRPKQIRTPPPLLHSLTQYLGKYVNPLNNQCQWHPRRRIHIWEIRGPFFFSNGYVCMCVFIYVRVLSCARVRVCVCVCVRGNLLSFLLRCETRPYERGTQ